MEVFTLILISEWGDTAVSGLGRWSHLPSKTGGLLEHWAMAFMPRHPFINESLAIMRENLEHPDYLMREDTPEADAEDSWTMRLTGPAMYQWTLHNILKKAGCRKVGNSYYPTLMSPERHCEGMDSFRSFFPAGLRLFRRLNLDNAVSHKIFHPADSWKKETTQQHRVDDYDDPEYHLSKETKPGFCGANAFARRAAARKRHWANNVRNND